MFNPSKDFPTSDQVISEGENSKNLVTLNGQDYLFAAFLDNGYSTLHLPASYINTLSIVENLNDFNMTGSIEYRDPEYGISSALSRLSNFLDTDCKIKNPNDDDPVNDVTNFVFKGTGGERLHIKLMPISVSDKEDLELNKKFKNEGFCIKHTFVITSVKDQPSPLSAKIYTINFESLVPNILKNNRFDSFPIDRIGTSRIEDDFRGGVDISTSFLPNYPSKGGGKSDASCAKTGEALYYIIYKALYDYLIDTGFDAIKTLPKINWESGGYVVDKEEYEKKLIKYVPDETSNDYKKIVLDKLPTDVWDFGPEESLLYTTFDGMGTNQILFDRFYNVHVSGKYEDSTQNVTYTDLCLGGFNYQPCLLHLQRGISESDENKITLRPLSSWISNFGKLDGSEVGPEFMDNFIFSGDSEYTRKGVLGVFKGFIIKKTNICKSSKVKEPVIIDIFSYDFMNPDDSKKFIVPHITELESGGNQTGALVFDGSFENCKLIMAELYVRHMKPDADLKTLYNMVNIERGSDKNKIRIMSRIPTLTSLIALGRNRLLKNMIFLNDMLTFRVEGSAHRQCGNFFGVDVDRTSDPNDELLNRLLGCWWVVELTHEIDFRDKTYINQISGSKFYKYKINPDSLEDPPIVE